MLPARQVGRFLERLVALSGVTEKTKTVSVKTQTLQPLKRIAMLVEEGVKH